MTRVEELSVKLSRVRDILKTGNLDGIYIKRQDNFAWLTCGGRNYVGAGDTGNCGLLVTADKTYAVSNNIEKPRMIAENFLEEMGFEYHSFTWHDNGAEAKILSELVASGRIGYDYGTVCNVANDIKDKRMDLVQAEMDRYLVMGRDASEAIETAAQKIRKGMTEYEISSMIIGNMEARGLEKISCMVAADRRIFNFRHPLPTDNRAEFRVQMGGNFRRDGLIICLTRYVSFGKPEERIVKQDLDNKLIDCTLIASSEPGVAYCDALKAGQNKYAELGYAEEFNKHHQGGPIGYAGRDYRVDFSVTGKIKEHQAFCWNPSITGTKSEDTYLCTKDDRIAVTGPVLFPKAEIKAGGFTFERPATLIL